MYQQYIERQTAYNLNHNPDDGNIHVPDITSHCRYVACNVSYKWNEIIGV